MSAAPGTRASPVELDLELCKACGVCIELCPRQVFDRDRLGEPVLARPEDCNQCLICEQHCPDFAIEVLRREPKGKRAAAEAGAGAEGNPALTREDLVAATKHAPDDHEGCAHNGEEG